VLAKHHSQWVFPFTRQPLSSACSNCRPQGLAANLLVPGGEDGRQPIPHPQQPAGRELELQVEIEHLDNLRECVAQTVVQPGTEHQHPVAQHGSGQGIGDDRLHFHFARWAPVAMDHMFRDHRLDHGYVFDVARPRLLAAAQWPAALRTDLGLMLDRAVDPCRSGTTAARMTRLPARLLPAARCGLGLLVNWPHARWRRRRLMGRRGFGTLLFGQELGHFQQRKDDGLLPLRVDYPRLLLRERRSQQDVGGRCRHGIPAPEATPQSYNHPPFSPTPTSIE